MSRQVALSLPTSPTSDAAAPNVNAPPPFALSGASPSLHARHNEQHFLFLLKSIKCLHWWHSHDEARRVADRSSGILLKEGEREIGQVAAGLAWKFRGEDPTIPIRGVYLNLHMQPPILCEISPPNIYWWESQGHTQLSVVTRALVYGRRHLRYVDRLR